MASWCCPHVSSGEVQPSVYVLTSYGRMAACRPTAERSRPAVHELLPAKCQNGKWRRARGPCGVCSGPETSPEESWGVCRPESAGR